MNQEIKKQFSETETILSNINENAGLEFATWLHGLKIKL